MAWPLRNDSDCGSRASVSAIALAAAAACCGGSLERLCSMSGLDRPVRNNHFWRKADVEISLTVQKKLI
jgi:hypothetical protein